MPTVIGIDIGGTKTTVVCMGDKANVIARHTLPTLGGHGFDADIGRIIEAIRSCNTPVDAIGIGCAGPVDPQTGIIHNPHTLPGWEGRNIIATMHEAFGCPVLLENDVDAAIMGERWIGAARDVADACMITLGTGVGFAAICGDQLYRGRRGEHPEFGHIPIDPNGPACYCGIGGCLESIASGTALTQAACAVGWADARELFDRYTRGDAKAKPIVEQAQRAMFLATWTMLHSFVPACIVLGGGLGEAHFAVFAAPMQHAIDQANLLPDHKPTITAAKLANDAGVIGAAYLAHTRT